MVLFEIQQRLKCTFLNELHVSSKTNRVVSTKWTYQKQRSFSSNCFDYLKILYQFKNLLQRVDLIYERPKSPYSYFLYVLEFYLTVLCPVSILKDSAFPWIACLTHTVLRPVCSLIINLISLA